MNYDVYMHFPVLAIMTLFVGAFLVTLVGKHERARNIIAGCAVLISFTLLALLVKPVMVDGEIIVYWMGNWEPVEGYAIGIAIEVDALSLFFGLLITIAVACSCFYSYQYIRQDDARGSYFTLYLMLSGGVLGIVLSGDLFNIYVMLEVMTFAAVGLTAFRTWNPNAREAAFKYLVVGSIGSTCALLGTALVYAQCHTLNLAQISAILPDNLNPTTVLAFALLFAGFGCKSFMFPFHPIAADAHGAAPSSVSVLISGVFTKTGVYGIIRVSYFLFRTMGLSSVQTMVVFIGCLSMFVCVTMALNQHDFKRLLAFHSISQIGYVLTSLGLCTALGIAGGLYHAINHTLFKGLLFLTAGSVLYATGTTYLENLGGLARKMPKTTVLFLIGAFSISGIPPFNGFYSKWLIYQATFEKAAETGSIGYALVTVVCVVTSVLTLASFIKVGHSVFFGQSRPELADVKDPPLGMRIPMWILAALCLLTGLFPNLMLNYIIIPATNAVYNAVPYIDTAMGSGYAAEHLASTAPLMDGRLTAIGAWQPISWLILFVVVLAALFLCSLMGRSNRASGAESDSKHAVFFGGEQAEYSHISGGDLFWGFKHNLRHYLGFMSRVHTGVTNDYVLWGVTATAVIIAYCFVFVL